MTELTIKTITTNDCFISVPSFLINKMFKEKRQVLKLIWISEEEGKQNSAYVGWAWNTSVIIHVFYHLII